MTKRTRIGNMDGRRLSMSIQNGGFCEARHLGDPRAACELARFHWETGKDRHATWPCFDPACHFGKNHWHLSWPVSEQDKKEVKEGG